MNLGRKLVHSHGKVTPPPQHNTHPPPKKKSYNKKIFLLCIYVYCTVCTPELVYRDGGLIARWRALYITLLPNYQSVSTWDTSSSATAANKLLRKESRKRPTILCCRPPPSAIVVRVASYLSFLLLFLCVAGTCLSQLTREREGRNQI